MRSASVRVKPGEKTNFAWLAARQPLRLPRPLRDRGKGLEIDVSGQKPNQKRAEKS